MATNIYFNTAAKDPQNATCLSEVNTGPDAILTMVLGSKIPVNLYLVDGAGAFDAISGALNYSVKVGIGKVGASATGGTYTLSYGGNTTSALAYNASAATVSTALNLLASIIAGGGVTVSGTWPVLVVTFNTVGVRTAITGTQDSFTPTSSLIIEEFQVGGVSTVSKWGIENAVAPPVYQTSWTRIANGWTAVLDLSTFELAALLAGVDATGLYFEVRITDPDGNPRVWSQPLMLVRNRVINPGSLVPAARDSYFTSAEVRDSFVQNRYLVDGLTGGTSADLDGIPTAGALATEGWMAAVVVANQLFFYRLEDSTQAESSPTWIRPDDYAAITNERVWHLLADPSISSDLTDFTEFGSYFAPDNVVVARAENIVVAAYNATLQPGASPVEMHLDPTNALPGNVVIFRVVLANTNSQIQIYNDGTIPSLMLEMSSDPSGLSTAVSIVAFYDGDNWQLASSTRSLGYAVDYIRQGTLSAANRMLVTDSGFAAATVNLNAASNTSSPNDTVHVASITSAEASTNADIAIVPKGTGAIIAAIPDGGVGGGNKRGANAVDLQSAQSGATRVASGPWSVIPGGYGNTASGQWSFAMGSVCVASGNASVALHTSNTASGSNTLATGRSSVASIAGQHAHASGEGRQSSGHNAHNTTANATPVELFCDGPGNTDARLVLGNSGTWTFEILVTAFCVASGESEAFRFFGLIHRGANAAATAIVGTVVKEKVSTTVWDFDVDADTTNGSLRLMATGEAGKTVLWNAAVRTSEIN